MKCLECVVTNLLPTAPSLAPFERWICCPNQPLDCDAYSVRISGRSLQMLYLLAPKMAINIPTLALTIRSSDEKRLPRPHQHPYSLHLIPGFLSLPSEMLALPFQLHCKTRRRSHMLSRLMSSCLDHLSVTRTAPFADLLVPFTYSPSCTVFRCGLSLQIPAFLSSSMTRSCITSHSRDTHLPLARHFAVEYLPMAFTPIYA